MAGQCHVFSVHWLVLECCENSISFSSGLIISLTLVVIFVQPDHICKHAYTYVVRTQIHRPFCDLEY